MALLISRNEPQTIYPTNITCYSRYSYICKLFFSKRRNRFSCCSYTPWPNENLKVMSLIKLIAVIKNNISNKEIGWLFDYWFPNKLDTTVEFEMINGKPDIYVITGDIDALQKNHACTGFMHESFHKDDASKFTR